LSPMEGHDLAVLHLEYGAGEERNLT